MEYANEYGDTMMENLKKILISTPALFILICVVVFAAQVAIVDTDTLNEAWTKETANNSDLQSNIDLKMALAGTEEVTGDKTFSGAVALNRLSNIIFSDGSENMASETFAFAANRTLKILDYNSQIAADALLDDTTGLLATDAQVVNTITSFASPTTANPYTLTAANSYNAVVYYGATGEIDIPALADGMAVVIYNTGAFTITIDPNASEAIVRDGTLQTGGVSFTLSSGAGNFVCIVSDGTNWVTKGFKGTLAEGT